MGYLTSYRLEVIEGDSSLIDELRKFSNDAAYAIDENGDSDECCKWYSHGEEMKRFSVLHPSALFKLKGEGEEAGDLWRSYYKNGKVQICKAVITYDSFDEEKLL